MENVEGMQVLRQTCVLGFIREPQICIHVYTKELLQEVPTIKLKVRLLRANEVGRACDGSPQLGETLRGSHWEKYQFLELSLRPSQSSFQKSKLTVNWVQHAHI